MAAQFFRARAWWQLDSVGPSALHVARSVVSLLDAAAYVEGLPDDDPGITALDAAGCFASGIFDPGPEGWSIVREWQLADEASAGPEDLLALLAQAAARDGPGAHLARLPLASLAQPAQPGQSELPSAPAATSIPCQLSPATEPAPEPLAPAPNH